MRRALAKYMLGVLPLLACPQIRANDEPGVDDVPNATPTIADIQYGPDHIRQRMDLYLPDVSSPPYPVVIWIHGGGWRSGDKSSTSLRTSDLRAAGLAVIGLNYRLSFEATFPAQLHDCKGAIRWIRANAASYGLNPDRIGVWGPSAGGHLAALVGTSGDLPELEGDVGGNLEFSSRVQAVVDFFGPTDILFMKEMALDPPGLEFDPDAPDSAESELIGWGGENQGLADIKVNLTSVVDPYPVLIDLLVDANPITHVRPGMPSFFIAHGVVDTRVPVLQSSLLWAALSNVATDVRYEMVAGVGHAELGDEMDGEAVRYFKSKLRPETVVEPIPTVSQWGLAIISLSMLIAGTVMLRRTRAPCIIPNFN